MKDGKSSRRGALAGLASRLRLLQAECADQSDAVRVQYLDEEINQSLERVLPQDRAAFLEELCTYFPAFQNANEPIAPVPLPATIAAPERPLDANALTEKLAQLSSGLTDEKKQQIARYLAKFGIAVPVPASLAPAGASAAVKESLGITSEDPLDIPRTMDAMAVLVQFTSDLDEVVWATWKQIATPNSSIRREMDLKRVIGGYITGESTATKTKLLRGVELLRRLIAALTASIPQAGRTASAELRKVSAEKVEEAVIAEKGRTFLHFDKHCWQKYKDLSDATKNVVESTVRKSIAQVVEEWMKTDR